MQKPPSNPTYCHPTGVNGSLHRGFAGIRPSTRLSYGVTVGLAGTLLMSYVNSGIFTFDGKTILMYVYARAVLF